MGTCLEILRGRQKIDANTQSDVQVIGEVCTFRQWLHTESQHERPGR